ncbi:sugar ABC transporter substrate-binding protein [Ruania alkalisoli]|uniref:Sugar ABC transporter substrate-binding protein n=1 Tax=Ruania alkalisoli TaxID=2779775 RepID=A0A7M1SWD1_9MICO|nr:sugar ABC transporter substrate-binding protein [Ruania alkalisoli]QOR71052.1 sugar ABC transporter substrate-binding protein [Ruania alkalisoli]
MSQSVTRSRTRIRTHGAVAVLAAGTLLLSACSGSGNSGGGSSDGSSTVTWSTWGSPEELERFEGFNEQFMADHEDITVELQPTAGYSDYHSKLLAQLTSGTAPDVFYVGDDRIGEFVDAGVLLPLSDLMDSDASQTPVDAFNPGVLGAGQTEDGEIYAVPNDVNPDALWYDKEALAAAGITEDPAELAANDEWTTETFLEMNDKLAEAGLIGSMYWNYYGTHWSWVSSQGGTAYDESGTFVGNTDATTVDAVQTFADYMQDGTFVVADTMPEGAGADSEFVTHGAGFFAQGRYTIGTLEEAGVAESYDIVRWPTPDGTAAPTTVAASYLVINADTPDPDAAFAFWTAYLSQEGQEFRLSEGGNAVPSIEGADDVVLADGYPEHAQTFLDMRDMGFANYAAESTVPGLSTDINEAMLNLYQGAGGTAQETLDQIAALAADG